MRAIWRRARFERGGAGLPDVKRRADPDEQSQLWMAKLAYWLPA